MTNKEIAAHFAALPADEPARVLLVNGDAGIAEVLTVDEPGTNVQRAEEVGDDEKKLPTVYRER